MPEYVCRAQIDGDVDEFTRGYLECAEWCGFAIEEERALFEACDAPRWSDAAIDQAKRVCGAFCLDNASDLQDYDPYRAGHDFWLTRNRHGAGYWDGDYAEDAGRRLTAAAHAWGETYAYFDRDAETLSLY